MSEELQRAEPAQNAESSVLAFNADLAAIKKVIKENMGAGGITEFDLPHIKVPSGGGIAFEITNLDGSTVEPKINAVVLFARDRRAYWPKSGNDTPAGTPPDCHSFDGLVGIGNPGGDCRICPLAQFNSAKQGKGQACKASIQLYLIRENSDSILPDILTLPPTSIKPFRTVVQQLSGRGKLVSSVVMEISLVKEKNPANNQVYSVAAFKKLRVLTPKEAAIAEEFSGMYGKMLDAAPLVPLSAPRQKEDGGGRLIDTVAEPPEDLINDPAFD